MRSFPLPLSFHDDFFFSPRQTMYYFDYSSRDKPAKNEMKF